MLILNRREVEQVLNMEMAILACKEAYTSVADASAVIPQRHDLRPAKEGSSVFVMSGYMPAIQGIGLKVVSGFPDNPKLGLDASIGAVMLLDSETGVPSVLMDGTYLTAVRTGAGSGIATDLLAVPEANSLALIGTGGMAWHQMIAVCKVRPIDKVYIWNRTRSKAETFLAKASKLMTGIEFELVVSPEAAVSKAMIICTGTSSPKPVVIGKCLMPGAHINAIGSYRPDWREIDGDVVQKASIRAVEAIPAGLIPGDLRMPIEQGLITKNDVSLIGDVLLSKIPGRKNPADITLFKSVGIAVQDIAVASRVLVKAREMGLGSEVNLM